MTRCRTTCAGTPEGLFLLRTLFGLALGRGLLPAHDGRRLLVDGARQALQVMLLVVGLVFAALDATDPCGIGPVPLDRRGQPRFKVVLGRPAQFLLCLR